MQAAVECTQNGAPHAEILLSVEPVLRGRAGFQSFVVITGAVMRAIADVAWSGQHKADKKGRKPRCSRGECTGA